MNQPKQKPQPKPLKRLTVSPETKERLKKKRDADQATSIPIDPEWLKIAELGYYYGWQAIVDVLADRQQADDKMFWRMSQIQTLINGAKKLEAQRTIDMGNAMFAALAASRDQKPDPVFRENLKTYYKKAQID